MKQASIAIGIVGMLASSVAVAQPEPSSKVLELTMMLVPADTERPDVVTARIELPKADASADDTYLPNAQGVANSAQGLETANSAREDGRAFGERAAAAARDDRENAGRATPPTLPEGVPPEAPPVPDPPGAPNR